MHPVNNITVDKIAILYDFIRHHYSMTKDILFVFVEKQFGSFDVNSTLFTIMRVAHCGGVAVKY